MSTNSPFGNNEKENDLPIITSNDEIDVQVLTNEQLLQSVVDEPVPEPKQTLTPSTSTRLRQYDITDDIENQAGTNALIEEENNDESCCRYCCYDETNDSWSLCALLWCHCDGDDD